MIALSVLNGAASAYQVYQADRHIASDTVDYFFLMGVGNAFYHTSILLSALSMFIGALAIAEEKANGSLSVLNAKPIYKRDVFVGKFVGLSGFLLLLTTVIIMLIVSTLMIFYRGPFSAEELFLRMTSYIIITFLSCVLTLGIAMLIGIWLKKLLAILIVIGTFLCIDWFYTIPNALQSLNVFVPSSLLFTMLAENGTNLINTASGFQEWLNGALPYIIFNIVEIVLIVLVSSHIISKMET